MIFRAVLFLLAALGLTAGLLLSTDHAAAAGVVGNGSPASCHDAALTAALNAGGGGGLVTFNCGPEPIEFVISQKTISYAANTIIDGNNLVTLSGAHLNRLFLVNAGRTLTLQNIDLYRGRAVGADGGAIRNNGTLFLTNSTIFNSEAGLSGGAIRTDGPLTITNSTLVANRGQNGGALFPFGSAATVTIINSELVGNQATGAAPDAGWGGAILMFGAMNVTIHNSDLHQNSGAYGGAIHSRFAGASLNLQAGTQVYNNEASAHGGGIYNLVGSATLTDVTLNDNSASVHAGGLFNNNEGTATLTNVTLNGNSAVVGGGISNVSGTVSLTNTTLTENVARPGGSGGGGILNQSSLTLTNVTLSGNSATGNGGGINNNAGSGVTTLTNVTLTGNSATGNGGGIYAVRTVTLKNTIVANSNAGGNCYQDQMGAIASSGFNLSDDTSCAVSFNQPGDQIVSPDDVGLGPLANNGGQTQTHLPMPGSLAVNHGSNSGCPATDQRGFPRVGICDVGSVEVQTNELATYTPTPSRTATSSSTPSVTTTPTLTPTPSRTLTPSPTIPGPTATATGTGTATATRSPTPPELATSTGIPTSSLVPGTGTPLPMTGTPTPPTGTLGGHGFNLETNLGGPAIARWTDGALETGYRGLRINLTNSLLTFFPSPTGSLGPDATTFSDDTPPSPACYFALVLGGNPAGATVLGQSDGVCLVRGMANGSPPSRFTVRLNETNLALLSWSAPPTGLGPVTVLIRWGDGSSPTFQTLAPGAGGTTHDTGGKVACYTLSVGGSTSDTLCAYPGVSKLGNASAASPASSSERFAPGQIALPRPQS